MQTDILVAVVVSMTLYANASVADTTSSQKDQRAEQIVQQSGLRQKLLSLIDGRKNLALLNYVSDDLRSDAIKQKRQIAKEEWSNAGPQIEQVVIGAVQTVLSEDEQSMLLQFFKDEALQSALTKLGTVQRVAHPGLARIIAATDTKINKRVAEEVSE
ncbi:hypothetical protein [uncultured Tateyamaria sp.]|uniref:hypothetical protein n=1 Tax=uncultured Tateyamaria sp. TaxID=455651 RepID=UPI002633075B|nr:hypothetical protein [uncultured Tateyamaria sp.]